MPSYKDQQNKTYFLSNEDISNGGEFLLPAGCVQITDAEAQSLANPAPTLAQVKTKAAASIKEEASQIVADTILMLGTEYQRAYDSATSFKAAGYTGTVPSPVQSWADAKVQTAQWAADDIIAAGNNWISAQDQIRANRLKYQEQAKNAVAQADVDAALSGWTTFKNAICAQLGI